MSDQPLHPGEIVDGIFEIIRQLGSGAMGDVYEAYDQRLGRRIALKISRDGAGEFLIDEARTLAALRHPAIIHVFHRGTHRAREYFSMELIEGRSLADHLMHPDPLPIETCLDLLDAITDAVDYLHLNQLVHRDLKPANVMIGPEDRVILLDFGIAMQERAAGATDEIVGSMHYLAPEALRGEMEVGDAHLVDLYALGVLAYEILTRQVPFDDSTPEALALQHLERVAPRPSSLRDDIPPRLDHLIAALLSKQAADRPASMSVVRGQLRAIRRWTEEHQTAEPPAAVLIVDDDPDVRALLRACVAQASPTTMIDVAGSVDAALARLRTRAYDVILLDLQLGDGSGVDLVMEKQALDLSRDARMVVISSHDEPANRELLAGLGAHAFISKHAGLLDLEDAVADQLFRERRRSGETTPPRRRRRTSRGG